MPVEDIGEYQTYRVIYSQRGAVTGMWTFGDVVTGGRTTILCPLPRRDNCGAWRCVFWITGTFYNDLLMAANDSLRHILAW